MKDNKVVIKINYDKSSAKQPPSSPNMVTQWHIGRIAMAFVALLSIGAMVTYFLLSPGQVERSPISQPAAETKEPLISDATVGETKPIPNIKVVKESDEIKTVEEIPGNETEAEVVTDTETTSNVEQVAPPTKKPAGEPIIKDARISRAVLARALNNKEPAGRISTPIVADRNKAVGVFFFTEINNMKGEVLFHRWFRNEKPVFKRKITILGNRWRATTSKMITYSGKGHWVVRLTDADGNIFSEIHFDVV